MKLVEGYISGLTQEQWVNNLVEENNTNLCLLKIHHVSQLPPFFDAFKQLMKGYANGENDALAAVNVNFAIEIALDLKHDIQRLFRDIRDIFMSTTISSQKLLFSVNGCSSMEILTTRADVWNGYFLPKCWTMTR